MEIAEHLACKNLINQTFRGQYLGPDNNACDSHLIEVNQGSPIESYFNQLRNIIPKVQIILIIRKFDFKTYGNLSGDSKTSCILGT